MNVKELIEELQKLDQYALVNYKVQTFSQVHNEYVDKVYEDGQGRVILSR